MVEERGSSPYAPSNERPGGRIIYKLNGPGFMVRGRRDDAYEQMHERCGGDYRILGEQDVAAGAVTSANAASYGNYAHGNAVTGGVFIHVIDFECGGEARRAVNEPETSGPAATREHE